MMKLSFAKNAVGDLERRLVESALEVALRVLAVGRENRGVKARKSSGEEEEVSKAEIESALEWLKLLLDLMREERGSGAAGKGCGDESNSEPTS